MRFSESILIPHNAELIFDYTQDYNNRLNWDTFLVEARLIDGATRADKGVKAWCVAKNGMGMETQYVSFNRPKVTAVKMTKGPYMFKEFAASWVFKGESIDATTVTFTYSFVLRFPFNLITWFVTRNLQANVRQRLVDLRTVLCSEKNYTASDRDNIAMIHDSFVIAGKLMIIRLTHHMDGLPAGTRLTSSSTRLSWKVNARLLNYDLTQDHKKFENEKIVWQRLSHASQEQRDTSVKKILDEEMNHIYWYTISPVGHDLKPANNEVLEIHGHSSNPQLYR